MAHTSILFVLPSPDDRTSTELLYRVIAEFERRSDLRVAVWYLRMYDDDQGYPGSRSVDSLRTWWLSLLLDGIGLSSAASAVRGLRLRLWFAVVRPDVVVLNDGLGERLLPSARRPPRRVVRLNAEPAEFLDFEPEPLTTAEIVIVPPGWRHPVPGAGRIVEDTIGLDRAAGDLATLRARGSDAARRRVRRAQDLPIDEMLVVGWGDDGWLDGSDVFVRALWALEHRHGIVAHGVWFGLNADPHEVERLHLEAERCGVHGRFHQRPTIDEDVKLCGDVIFLPYRSADPELDLVRCVVGGSAVVTFVADDVAGDEIRVVPHLDVERAADELAHFLRQDRDARWRESLRRFHVTGFVDYFLDLVGRR